MYVKAERKTRRGKGLWTVGGWQGGYASVTECEGGRKRCGEKKYNEKGSTAAQRTVLQCR